MESNFFAIDVSKVHAYQYDLTITPVPRCSADCRKFLEISLAHAKVEHKKLLYSIPEDDKEPIRTFYSRTKLEGIDNTFTFIENIKKTQTSKEYTIRIRQTKELIGTNCGEQLINAILNDSIQKLNYVCLKSGFYDMENIKTVDRTPVRLARGFEFTINKSKGDKPYTLCIKPNFLTLQSETLSDVINDLRRDGRSNEEISDKLRNKNIFLPHSNRFYKIMKLDFNIKPTDSFPEGTEFKTIVDYFEKRYPRLPAIFRSFKDGDIFNEMRNDVCMAVSFVPMKQRNMRQVRHNITTLPPSICIMGGQPNLRPLDQASVTQARQLTPKETLYEVRSIISKISGLTPRNGASEYEIRKYSEIKDILDDWGVSINTQPVKVQGKKIPMPFILTGSNPPTAPDPMNGSFRKGLRGPPYRTIDTKNNPFFNWVFMCTERDKTNFWNDESKRVLSTMKIDFNDPLTYTMRFISGAEVKRTIDRLRRDRPQQKPSIVIVGLQNNDASTYKDIKRVCAEQGLVSQCINMSNLSRAIRNRKADSYLWGLFQQIVSKVGGVVWTSKLEINQVTTVPTMLCGIHYVPPSSVSTSQGGSNQFTSKGSGASGSGFLSMCCTYDKTFVRHFNQCKAIDASRGVSRAGAGLKVDTVLGDMIFDAFDFFGMNTSITGPKKLIIMRSGLPEGEVKDAVNGEIDAIKKRIGEYLVKKKNIKESDISNNMPKITFIVVKRRCNARFVGQMQNLIPGTYIDDSLLVSEDKGFYMVSGFTPKRGQNDAPCTKPVFYSVELNESNDLTLNDIKTLLFHTSFNYVNYPGPQSLPTTIRYAVSVAQHVSEKTGVAPKTLIRSDSMNAYPFFI